MEDQGTGIAIGNFDIGLETVENRIQLMVIDRILRTLVQQANLPINQEDIEEMREEAIDDLNEQYPDLGIEQQ